MGRPGLLASPSPVTFKDPEKVGSTRLVPAQSAGGAGKFVVSRAVVMLWTEMVALRLLWTLNTTHRVTAGVRKAGVPEHEAAG
jgi:hypothetical protein